MTDIAATVQPRFALSLGRVGQLLALGVLFLIAFVVLQGNGTLPHKDDSQVFLTLNGVRDWVDANRSTNPVFVYVLGPIRAAIDGLDGIVTSLLSQASWIGLLAVAGALALAFVSWRTALLVIGSLLAIGLLGLWTETLQTLVLIANSVALSLLIGIPLGILAGRNDRFLAFITPILDFMQIMPTFAYLAPLTLIFLIGPASAVIATLIYAMPPAIRITSLGIRGVPVQTVEAAESLGATDGQVLRKVQLPIARRTIGLAVNQTIMMALSIIVIAALINAPGLGESIIVAIEKLKFGAAVTAGIAIVLLAMVLDRITASASGAGLPAVIAIGPLRVPRRTLRIIALAIAVVGLLGGALASAGSSFPAAWHVSIAKPLDDAVRWVELTFAGLTDALKNGVSAGLLDPIQTVLTTSPWWLVIAAAAGIAAIVNSTRAAVVVAVALVLIVLLQVWEHAMQTLTMVIVSVVLTMAIGIVLGVWAARNRVVSAVLRPINDAAQTLPSFVYLLPALALFGPTRFTAILAAVIYSVPAVVRLVEDGVRGVSPTVIEAATAAGASRLQMIRKVQLPMARRSLLVATNQGVVLVLAMVVLGGLVGAQALGFDVVSGFSQRNFFGRGVAAAIGIVLLGVMLDRITQGTGQRRSVRGVVGRLGVGLNSNRASREA
ncbi:MAG: ABC transporter permease subunit [Chloroflexi bacterium]|nr:MAG: ABC transporter permease subunit [Chloroflexota bacterium]